jgi:hypothetical protein
MKHYPWRYVIMAVITALFLCAGNALAKKGETVEITNPTEGATVSGLLTLTGTIEFPEFMKYELFLKTGSEMIWAATVYAPVAAGNLAYVDTRTYPDGMYQLIMRTVRTDSNYAEYTGPNFLIQNNLGAPQPYPEMESSPLYPPVAGALTRIRNCSGNNLSFTYGSPHGFCSADDLWIPFKQQDSPVCPYVDILLIPNCEYRGTAIGRGETRGANYSFMTAPGKIYELTYSGRDKLYITESKGTSQPTAAPQELTAAAVGSAPQPAVTTVSAAAKPSVAASTPAAPAQEPKPMLPVSGQGHEAKTAFVAAALGLIVLLVIGGVVALRKRSRPA